MAIWFWAAAGSSSKCENLPGSKRPARGPAADQGVCPTILMLEYLLALGVVQSLAIVPRPFAEPLARLYTRFLDLAIPRLRRVGMRNLELALPEVSPEARAG